MKAMKMTDLVIDEMSGVDHPAHAHEGWLVVKARDAETAEKVTRVISRERGVLMRKAMSGAAMEEEEKEAQRSADEARLAELEKRIAAYEDRMGKQEDKELPPFIQQRMREREAKKKRMMEEKKMNRRKAMYSIAEGGDEDTEMMEDDEEEQELMKSASPAVRMLLQRYAKSRDDALTELRKERDRQEDADAVRKAADEFKHLAVDPGVLGPALRRLATVDSDLAAVVKSALRTANAQNEPGSIFSELGAGGATSGNAYVRLTSMAKAAVANGSSPTLEQAISKIAVDNPHLYEDYLRERV